MMPARIRLDFERPAGSAGPLGAAVLGIGILLTVLVLLDYQRIAGEIAALELRQESRQPADRELAPAVARGVAEAATAVQELATPWSALLAELEQAGQDSKGDVALLGIETDRERGRVRILGEARTLPAALLYVHRLQDRGVLHDALLDSHEIQVKDPNRPVRFQLTAGWTVSS